MSPFCRRDIGPGTARCRAPAGRAEEDTKVVGAMARSVVPMEPREWHRLQSLEMGAAVVPASSVGRSVCRNITCLHDAHASLDMMHILS